MKNDSIVISLLDRYPFAALGLHTVLTICLLLAGFSEFGR